MKSQWSSCIVRLGGQLRSEMCLFSCTMISCLYSISVAIVVFFMSAEDSLDSPGTTRLIHNLKLRISPVPLRLPMAAVIKPTPHGKQLPWVQPQIHLQSESDHSQSELWFWFIRLFLGDNPKS